MRDKRLSDLLTQYENITKKDNIVKRDNDRLSKILDEKYLEIRKRVGDEKYYVSFQFYIMSSFLGQLSSEAQKDCTVKAQCILMDWICKTKNWRITDIALVVSMLSETTKEALDEMKLPL